MSYFSMYKQILFFLATWNSMGNTQKSSELWFNRRKKKKGGNDINTINTYIYNSQKN